MARAKLLANIRDYLRTSTAASTTDIPDIDCNKYVDMGCIWTNLDVSPTVPFYVADVESTSAAVSPAVPDEDYFLLLCANTVGQYIFPRLTKYAGGAVNISSTTGHVDSREVYKAYMRIFEMQRNVAKQAASNILGRGYSYSARYVDLRSANPNRRVYSANANVSGYREGVLQIDNAYSTTSKILEDAGWRSKGTWPAESSGDWS